MDEDTLIVNNVMDMRVPGGRGEHKQDGANQNMGMYFKDTPFAPRPEIARGAVQGAGPDRHGGRRAASRRGKRPAGGAGSKAP